MAEVYEDNDVSATRGEPRSAYLRMMQDAFGNAHVGCDLLKEALAPAA